MATIILKNLRDSLRRPLLVSIWKVDCVKFRNKLGLDIPLEALRLARQRKRVQNRERLHYARLLRVENPMSLYLQAIE